MQYRLASGFAAAFALSFAACEADHTVKDTSKQEAAGSDQADTRDDAATTGGTSADPQTPGGSPPATDKQPTLPEFGVGGVLHSDLTANQPRCLPAGDGRLLVHALTGTFPGGAQKFELHRLLADGSSDAAYDAAALTTPFMNSALDSQGRLVLGGLDENLHLRVQRRLADGGVDASFASIDLGAAMSVSSPNTNGSEDAYSGVAVGPDDAVVLAHATTSDLRIAKVDAHGSLVDAFGTHGVVTISATGSAPRLVVLPDGRVLIMVAKNDHALVFLLAADGQLDLQFGAANGTLSLPTSPAGSNLNFVRLMPAVTSQGFFLPLSGGETTLSYADFAGVPVAAFGSAGSVTLPLDEATATLVVGSNVYVGGWGNYQNVRAFAVIPLGTADGKLGSAKIFPNDAKAAYLSSLALVAPNRLIACGYTYGVGGTAKLVANAVDLAN